MMIIFLKLNTEFFDSINQVYDDLLFHTMRVSNQSTVFC